MSDNNSIRQDSDRLIIGIDLATTQCCIATAIVPHDWEDKLLNNYRAARASQPRPEIYSDRSSYQNGRKWPSTALYYDGSDRLPKTGNELERFLKDQEPEDFNRDRYFRLWKLLFHDGQGDGRTMKIKTCLQQQLALLGRPGKPKSRDNLLRDWVEVIYLWLFEAHIDDEYSLRSEDYGSRFNKLDIEIVVAVPPGRSTLAHEEVRQAFIQGPIDSAQVSLVSEPEAAFRSYVYELADKKHWWEAEQKILMLDGGGGTCCLVRFRLDTLEPLGFVQESESESTTYGAETIDDAFTTLISTKIPEHITNRAWVLDQLRTQFSQRYKLEFGEFKAKRGYPFVIPGKVDITVSEEELARCFDGCIAKVIEALERQLARGPVDRTILAGGLFSSPYVWKAMENHLKSVHRIKSQRPPNDTGKAHVAKGAVLVKMYERRGFITRRPIKRSKAVTTWYRVTDEIRESAIYPFLHTKISKNDGLEYFWAAQWLAKQGYQAEDMHEISSESSFKDARTRTFAKDSPTLQFSETILTFDYYPGDQLWAAQRFDGRWMDMQGNLIPDPEGPPDIIEWDPRKVGIDVGNLAPKAGKDGSSNRVLHYSIQMQLKEVETVYWIKMWYWPTLKNGKGRAKRITTQVSKTNRLDAVFATQEISQMLLESFKLGTGIYKENDLGASTDLLSENEQLDEDDFVAEASTPPVAAQAPSRNPDFVTQAATLRPTSELNHFSKSHNAPSTMKSSTSTPRRDNKLRASLPLNLSEPPRSNKRKRESLVHERREPPFTPFSRKTLRHPGQMQRDDSGHGEPGKGSGCWTCSSRFLICDRVIPTCTPCINSRSLCRYGRNTRWDEYPQGVERQNGLRVAPNNPPGHPHTFPPRARDTSAVPTSRSLSLSHSTSIDIYEHPGSPDLEDARRSRAHQPSMVPLMGRLRELSVSNSSVQEHQDQIRDDRRSEKRSEFGSGLQILERRKDWVRRSLRPVNPTRPDPVMRRWEDIDDDDSDI